MLQASSTRLRHPRWPHRTTQACTSTRLPTQCNPSFKQSRGEEEENQRNPCPSCRSLATSTFAREPHEKSKDWSHTIVYLRTVICALLKKAKSQHSPCNATAALVGSLAASLGSLVLPGGLCSFRLKRWSGRGTFGTLVSLH